MNRSNDSSRTVAELRDELLGVTHPSAVRRIASAVRSADEVQALYALLSAGEEPLAYRAAWTLCHLAPTWDAVLRDRYDELVAAALDCPHAGRRRLLLALLYRQPQPEPLRVDFLDFCLDAMTDPAQPHAVRMYCMKLACEMCRTQKDLLHEFRTLVELLEPDLLPPSLRAVRRNVLASNRDPRSADHRDLHLHNKNPSFRKEGFGKVRRYGPMACPANRRYFA